MGTFGHTSPETGVFQGLNGEIVGSMFTCPVNCTAQSITAYLKRNDGSDVSHNMKCAIYKHSDLSLIAATDQRAITLTTTWTWYTFTFSAPPNLIGGTEYILVCWSNNAASTAVMGTHVMASSQEHYQTIAYDGFPNPLVPTTGNDEDSIYCTYTTGGQIKGGGVANKMVSIGLQCESWKERFPKLTARVIA